MAHSILFALAAALANIIGGLIVTSQDWARRSLRYFIALGAGFMLGTVFLEMAPESFELTRSAPALILVGYLIVHLFEHAFASHLHFGEETHHDEMTNPVVGISSGAPASSEDCTSVPPENHRSGTGRPRSIS